MKTIKSIGVFCFCVSFITFCQGYNVDLVEYSKRLKETSDHLRSMSQAASDNLQHEVDKFYSALAKHDVVKRDIESSFDHLTNRVEDAPEHCKESVKMQLDGLKAKTVNDYLNCTSKTIFKSVGDSVKIVTVSFDLLHQVFQSLDDALNGFTDCYSSGVMHSIGCSITSLGSLVNDVKSSVDLGLTYRDTITSLSTEITNVINACQNKSHKSSLEAVKIVTSC